ncbi:ABC transporter ATP-binding protein [Halioxenophilus sp. WMMB6]|uniref:ABC transporter ATP-binding protein n=1 Tax=Halioxenophilus sp. WMMB6 TaxID=3073815 RepID=UPI00295EDDA4|nr:ABC transporter ATP-binding protein [Halioxenophilus sp. WMMB6]
MLEVNRLSRNYGAQRAVDEVTFTVAKGEIVGLLGHNGAGKTTIMKMITGFLEPDTGYVQVDGIDVATDPKKIQQGLGYLPENLPVYPEMSVADYLDYCATLKGLAGPEKISAIRYALAATDIQDKLASAISTLSRGYKQRVGVAQAILGRPKLLVLDEPTNGLDPEQTQHMRRLIRELAKEATVILSTHILQEVSAICSRVLILRSGQLVVDESLASLSNSRSVILHSNLPSQELPLLKGLAGVQSVEALPVDETTEASAYRLHLGDGGPLAEASARIAKAVIGAGFDLYQLNPQQQDLESLFHSAGAPVSEEASHAA